MLHETSAKKRKHIFLACVDVLVPQNHLLRKIIGVIDWTFIYDLVKEKYSPDMGQVLIRCSDKDRNHSVFVWYSQHAANDP